MNIKKIIKDTLEPICQHVFFQNYTGNTYPYISFFNYLEQGEAWAENTEKATGYYVQVDIFSKSSDYDDLVDKVKTAMEAVGFIRTMAQDLYEKDTKIFHKAMRFVYVENI